MNLGNSNPWPLSHEPSVDPPCSLSFVYVVSFWRGKGSYCWKIKSSQGKVQILWWFSIETKFFIRKWKPSLGVQSKPNRMGICRHNLTDLQFSVDVKFIMSQHSSYPSDILSIGVSMAFVHVQETRTHDHLLTGATFNPYTKAAEVTMFCAQVWRAGFCTLCINVTT